MSRVSGAVFVMTAWGTEVVIDASAARFSDIFFFCVQLYFLGSRTDHQQTTNSVSNTSRTLFVVSASFYTWNWLAGRQLTRFADRVSCEQR